MRSFFAFSKTCLTGTMLLSQRWPSEAITVGIFANVADDGTNAFVRSQQQNVKNCMVEARQHRCGYVSTTHMLNSETKDLSLYPGPHYAQLHETQGCWETSKYVVEQSTPRTYRDATYTSCCSNLRKFERLQGIIVFRVFYSLDKKGTLSLSA